jgi:phosphatidylglycerol:prolipoprotein diacylglycerol transferase
MNSVLFRFFGLPVYAYGTAFAIAIGFAAWHIRRLAMREGIKPEAVLDALIVTVVSALVGARLFHVLQPSEWAHYREHPAEIFKLWEGGLVFYGGLIGCFVTLPFVFRAHKIRFWTIADCFAPAIALGHAFVRLGCFMNGCCYGRKASWGLIMPEVDGYARQPSQLYEAAAGVALFAFLVRVHPNRRFRGQTMLVYLLLHAAARFAIEFTRDDPRGGLAFFSTSQWVALGVAGLSGGLWPWLSRRYPLPEPGAAELAKA